MVSVSVSPFLGPYLAGSLLLIVASIPKIVRPLHTSLALKEFGIPASPNLVRGGSAVEACVGIAALFMPGRWPSVLVAASYLAFTLFVAVAMFKGSPLATCGCFGEPDTPPTALHIVVTLCIGLCAGIVARGPVDLSAVVSIAHTPWAGVPVYSLSAVLAFLGFVALVDLPRARAAR